LRYGIEVKALEVAQDSLNLVSNATILNSPQEFGSLAKANSSDYDIRLIVSASKFPAQIIKIYSPRAAENGRCCDQFSRFIYY
jgi:hypothetical protein